LNLGAHGRSLPLGVPFFQSLESLYAVPQNLPPPAEAVKQALFELSELPPAERSRRLQALQAEQPALAAALLPLLPGALATAEALGAPARWAAQVQAGGWPERLGAWRVLREIGRGGMGVVLLGERADGAFDKQVAIKVLPPALVGNEGMARLAAETRALGRLEHPNIARLLDAGHDQGCAYLVMEYVEGDLLPLYARRAGLDARGRVRLLLDLCSAVQFAHAQLLVHRDIKPANVLVDRSGRVRLLDFGIAKVLSGEEGTHTQRAACTPAYASPEQLLGQPVSVATDVFSLGVVLYELLGGQRPFGPSPVSDVLVASDAPATPSTLATLRAVLESDPATQPLQQARVPQDLQAIVLKALEKPLARRYASVEALAADLQAFLQGHPVAARVPSAAYRARKFVARNRWAVAGTSLATVAVLGSAAWAQWNAVQARHQQQVAQTRLEAVRSIANKVVFDYNRALEPVPGTLEVRKTLVADALKYLDALGREAQGDRALQADIAAGFEAVGDVQGRGVTGGNLGDLPGAKLSYERALALRQPLCETAVPAQHLAACGAWAQALVRLGDNLFTTQQTPQAVAQFEQARQVSQQALATAAGAGAGAGAGAVAVAAEADRNRALDARFEATQRLAGLSGRQTGEAYARGLEFAREQLQAAQELARVRPGLVSQENLRVANDLVAVRLLGAGQAEAALPLMEQSIALARELSRTRPGRDAGVSLSGSLMRLAEIQAHRQQPALARAALDEGLALARSLHEAEPQDRHLRARYANVARRWALANNLIDDDAARQANRQVLPQVMKVSGVFKPEDGVFYLQHQYLQVELAQALVASGDASAALEALAGFPQALPPNPRAALDLAPVFLLRARALAALGRDEPAKAAFDIGHGVLLKSVQATPADVQQACVLLQAQQWAQRQTAWADRQAALAADSARRLAALKAAGQLTPWWAQQLG